MADRVIQRNDTAARWKEVNPVLAMGEIGIETDGAKGYKIGDGVTHWNDLAYPANPTSVVQEGGTSETAVMSQKAVTEKIGEVEQEIKGKVTEEEIFVNERETDAYFNFSDVVLGETYQGTRTAASEGTMAYKIAVSVGQKYKIVGMGKNSAAGLYAYTGEGDIVLAVEKVANHRVIPVIVEITENGFLYINLTNYIETDYVASIVSNTEGGIFNALNNVNVELDVLRDNVNTIGNKVGGIETELKNEIITTLDKSNTRIYKYGFFNGKTIDVGSEFIGSLKDGTDVSRTDKARFEVPAHSKYILKNKVLSPSTSMINCVIVRKEDNIVISKNTNSDLISNPLIGETSEDLYIYVNVSNGYQSSLTEYNENEDFTNDLSLTITQVDSLKKIVISNKTRIEKLENSRSNWIMGKTVVLLGDSQIGQCVNLDKLLMDFLPITAYRCGFSGCNMASRRDDYTFFCMYNVANCIADNDYTSMENALSLIGESYVQGYTQSMNILKSIDFGDGDNIIFTIQYGGNDYRMNTPIGNDDSEDTSTMKGATQYVISRLLTALPKAKIIFIGQPYRVIDHEGETILTDSNNTPNSLGKYRVEYGDACGEVASANQLPYFDMYRRGGRNKYNAFMYGADGTHPTKEYGQITTAEIYCKILQSF